MRLKEYMANYTREQLLDQARSLELRNYSKLRKADLIEQITDGFCTEKVMRSRLACLTDEQLVLVRKACVEDQDLPYEAVVDGIQLYRYWIGHFEEDTDKFSIFEDVADIFRKIDDSEFRKDQRKKGWMVKCVQFFVNYYGIAPLEVIYDMYSLKISSNMDEMIDMMWNMPADIIASGIFTMDMLGMQDWPETDPVYSKNGLLVYMPLLEDEGFDSLLKQQMGKDFYIPSENQIDEICRYGYEESLPTYRKLKEFFMKRLHLQREQACSWCLNVWANSYEGDSPTDLMEKMSEANIELKDDKELEEFMQLQMNAHNDTRMRVNRGHKPRELAYKNFLSGPPKVVPGSSNAAALLKDAADQLKTMGIQVDLDGNADVISTTSFPDGINGKAVRSERKVYPNDPCPCGSGKKYKKCCGRK